MTMGRGGLWYTIYRGSGKGKESHKDELIMDSAMGYLNGGVPYQTVYCASSRKPDKREKEILERASKI